MSSTYAGQPVNLPEQCRWRFHWEDVDLACRDQVVPGEVLCADHYIEHVHAEDIRAWPARPVPVPDATAERA